MFSPDNMASVGGGYVTKVGYKTTPFYQPPPPGRLIIGGSRTDHDIPRIGPVAAEGIDSESPNFNNL